MPKMKIKGIGIVEVTKLPKRIPKYVRGMFGEKIKMDKDVKEAYNLFWATKYATKKAREKVLKEIGLMPKKLKRVV